jgi:hypothetical protein
MSRGKMSDRAVHISFLPHGTVIFEKILSQDLFAYVSSEPKSSSSSSSSRQSNQEEPGMLRLLTPIEYNEELLRNHPSPSSSATKTVTHVELWGRCMACDGIASTLRIGDLLKIDAIFYRPEKLIFARNVRIEKYRSLGRLFGTVCEIKEGRGYGFIKCLYGGPDTYFKTSEVIKAISSTSASTSEVTGKGENQLMEERNVKMSLPLSYECSVEEVSTPLPLSSCPSLSPFPPPPPPPPPCPYPPSLPLSLHLYLSIYLSLSALSRSLFHSLAIVPLCEGWWRRNQAPCH